MARFVVRVWLPDRPGALGLVAGGIGAAGGDVIGIEILEQGGGRAVDELVVELADDRPVDDLVREVAAIDGVDVEWVLPLGQADHDPQLALLEAAARLVETDDDAVRLGELCAEVSRAFEADWACVIAVGGPMIVARAGEAPSASWVAAFVLGSRHLEGTPEQGAEDIAWADLRGRGQVVAVGRGGRPFRSRERRQLEVLARISASLPQGSPVAQARERWTPRSQVS